MPKPDQTLTAAQANAAPTTDRLVEMLRCPRSRSRLAVTPDGSLVSADGRHRYPVVAGFPDFRLFDAPYADRVEERRRVDLLTAAEPRLSFDDLVRYYETEILTGRPADRVRRSIEHRLTQKRRSVRRLGQLFEIMEITPSMLAGPAGAVLDLGCGSGETLEALARISGGPVAGIDISLEELVLARKRLAEERTDAVLIAACAEALPVADGSFGFILSTDVIEHVADQRDYLLETRRVLAPGGKVLLNSPNRFSAVSP
ncbi:MAG TPA: class I SAM-dependent methyltransferase, partial [Arenibaculum sp.]|nr:class I SAM-dependent methyltransferase [Arenibaculum sp.]